MLLEWIERFHGLMSLELDIRNQLLKQSQVVRVPEGTVIFGPGKAPENLLLLLEGTVRVQQVSEQGREIVLYRVNTGESCILTTACLLAYEEYSAESIAETEVKAVAIPKTVFDDIVAHSSAFRNFVFSAYSHRITDLFHVIEEVAFQRMDIRMAEKIMELKGANDQIHATHQQMAAELGTAREVVSRILSEFQRREWIKLSRGVIKIVDVRSISDLANAR